MDIYTTCLYWGLGIGPNPQSPIPNPQSPEYKCKILMYVFTYVFIIYYI